MKSNTHYTRRVSAILCGALAIQTAMAQTAPTASSTTTPQAAATSGTGKEKDQVMTLEAFVTTGSNIKRVDQEKTLPVTVFDQTQIEARDAATPMDLLSGIPEITNIPRNETSTNAVAARGDNANVALRGLGEQNTLVLLNGVRMPFEPFNTSAVNVNVLPTAGVQRIELLRDGASAVYGSDAVAGVVNYVTKKVPDGSEVSLRIGVTEHGGGTDVQGSLFSGFTFGHGKGTWVFSASGYYREAILLAQRPWSANSDRIASARAPWNVAGSAYDGLTSTAIWPSYKVGSSSTVQYFYPVNGTPTLTATAMPRTYYTDYNKFTFGQPRTSRNSFYNHVEYELTPSIRTFGEAIGYWSKSRTERQPITLSASDRAVTLSVDNPYNPYGSRFYEANGAPNADGSVRLKGTPQTTTVNTLLMSEGGNETINATDRMYRLLGGFSGGIGTSSWTWQAEAMLGGVRATDFAVNSIRDSKLIAAAQRSDASAFNPFGYTFKVVGGQVVADQTYVNPKSVRDAYTMSANRYGHSKIATADAKTSGTIVDLWAGPIAASLGGEWRYEMKEDHKDPYASFNPAGSGLDVNDNDILVMSPKANYHGSRAIGSAFAETIVPLIAPKNDLRYTNSLEANASVRYEHYSDFGSTTKPKFGANWKPLPFLMVRASLNKGFRAPDLADLYQPTAFSVASPPGVRDTVRNNFFTGAGLAADVQELTKTYSLSNPTLKPEESKGRSIGIAIDVPKVKGLSLTADYWEIEQKNLIVTQTRDSALDEQLLRAYTQQQLAAGKSIDQIDVGYHTSPDSANTYVGDIRTLRAPVNDADRARFAAANAKLPQSQWMAPVGEWLGSISQIVNSTGKNYTNGFDLSASYSIPKTRYGQFLVQTEWSKMLNKYTKTTATSAKNDDLTAMILPQWKSSSTVVWRNVGWSASVNITYTSAIRTGANTNVATYNSLGQPSYIKAFYNNGAWNYYEKGKDQTQVNVGLGYRFDANANRWLRSTSFRLGVNNLFDTAPSPQATASGYSGAIGGSLWVGRAFTLNMTREF